MEVEDFSLLSKSYAPIIEKMISDNFRFYGFQQTIKWGFVYDKDVSIFGAHDRKTNILKINLLSVMASYLRKDFHTIEYFLMHEIRHIFQRIEIEDYINGKATAVDENIVKRWKEEEEHYVTALDKDGNENKEYFSQDLELDAYAFAYAIMVYKYGKNLNLYIPPYYGDEFYSIVDEWLTVFKEDDTNTN